MALKQLNEITLSNPADREKLFKIIKDCSDSLTRAEAERDFVKEAITDISKHLQMPKKLVKKLVTVYHKQNFDEEVAEQDQFQSIYEKLTKK